MNFKTSEINKWYKTKSGVINSKLIINAINKVFYPSSDKKIIYFGPNSIIKKIMNENYSFNIQKNILYKDLDAIELTQKESEVISLLIQNRGVYLSIESLHEVVWRNKDIQYADIRMCIKRIRDKTDKEFILNKRFVGYKIDK